MSLCFPRLLSVPALSFCFAHASIVRHCLSLAKPALLACWSCQKQLRDAPAILPPTSAFRFHLDVLLDGFVRSLDIDAKLNGESFSGLGLAGFIKKISTAMCWSQLLRSSGPIGSSSASVPPCCLQLCFSAKPCPMVSATCITLKCGDHCVRLPGVAGPIIGKGRKGLNRRAKSTGMECEGRGLKVTRTQHSQVPRLLVRDMLLTLRRYTVHYGSVQSAANWASPRLLRLFPARQRFPPKRRVGWERFALDCSSFFRRVPSKCAFQFSRRTD